MNAILGRVIASLIAALAVWLGNKTGIELTADDQATLSSEVTIYGLAAFGIIYAAAHKMINRKLAPLDTAKPVESAPLNFRSR